MEESVFIQRFLAYQSAYMDGLATGIGDDISKYRRVYEDSSKNTLKILTSYLKSKKNDENFSLSDIQSFVNILKSYSTSK